MGNKNGIVDMLGEQRQLNVLAVAELQAAYVNGTRAGTIGNCFIDYLKQAGLFDALWRTVLSLKQ